MCGREQRRSLHEETLIFFMKDYHYTCYYIPSPTCTVLFLKIKQICEYDATSIVT